MSLHNGINITSFTGLVKNISSTNILVQAIAGTDYYSPGNPTYLIDDTNISSIIGNIGVGTDCLSSLILGSGSNTYNCGFGPFSLNLFTTGTYNTGGGFKALANLVNNSSNSVWGALGFRLLNSGDSNSGLGVSVGLSMTSGSFNTFVGAAAGANETTYNQCCFFGALADAAGLHSSLTNAIGIGYQAIVGGSNTIVMGNTSITTFNIPGINLGFTANTITSTNTNGNLVLTPNGIGIISLSNNTGLGTTTANSALQFANALNYRTLTLYENTNNSYQYYGFGIQPNILVYNVGNTTSRHAFYAGTSSSASQELMRITATGTTSNSGCIGINITSTPSAGCHVIGGVQNLANEDTCFRAESSSYCAKMEFNCTATGGRLYEVRSTNTGTLDIVDRTGSAERLVVSTTGIGIFAAADTTFSVTTGSADKPGGGSWGSFSDGRIKEIIRPYSTGLAEILQINPKVYKYTEDSKLKDEDLQKERIGIIAQEIEDILPECIELKEAKGFEDLRFYDSSPILYAMINAIKELNQRLDALEIK